MLLILKKSNFIHPIFILINNSFKDYYYNDFFYSKFILNEKIIFAFDKLNAHYIEIIVFYYFNFFLIIFFNF